MTRFVLDASVALSWCFEDEVNEYAETVLAAIETQEAVVPCIWIPEIANIFSLALREGAAHAGPGQQDARDAPVHEHQDRRHGH